MHPQFCKSDRRNVNREVVARKKRACSDQRQYRHEGFRHHCSVADEAGVPFFIEHLGCCARTDKRMEARNRTAGDGPEQEGEELPLDDRSASVDELGHGGACYVGVAEEYATNTNNSTGPL